MLRSIDEKYAEVKNRKEYNRRGDVFIFECEDSENEKKKRKEMEKGGLERDEEVARDYARDKEYEQKKTWFFRGNEFVRIN